MIKNLKAALIILTLPVFFTGRAFAVVLGSEYINSQINKEVTKVLKQQIKGDISVEVKNIPYSEIQVNEGKITFNIENDLNFISPHSIVRVNILVDGEKVKTFGAAINIKVQDYVWVANDYIYKGKAFSSQNLILKKEDISSVALTAARENFNYGERFSTRMFKPGDVIDARYTEIIPDVIKNSLVNVIFQTSNIKVVMDGEALENGKIGDYIKVRNKKYKKDYTGKVISENQILVNI